ncbi:MAG: hypothetical protein ACREX3_08550 [Gammaproteobacteria bacterium]
MATGSSDVYIRFHSGFWKAIRSPLRKTFVFVAPDNHLVQPIEPVIGLVDAVYEIDMNGVDALIRLVDTAGKIDMNGVDATALVSKVNVDVVEPLVGELQGGFDFGIFRPNLLELGYHDVLKESLQYAHQL